MPENLSKVLLFALAGQGLARTQRTPGALYLHVPRGSNNRLKETTAVVQNEKRLFWSNNNARGGYNVGETTVNRHEQQSEQHNMGFFMSNTPSEGASYLNIEWSQLHGCGKDEDGEKIHDCNMKIQYMCQDDLEDPDDVDDLEDAYTLRNGIDPDMPFYEHAPGEWPDPEGGCYRDNGARDLPDVRIRMERENNRMEKDDGTIESGLENCQRRCAEEGYIYVGLQFGGECWCANQYNNYGRIDDESQCNMDCWHDRSIKCGGPWANNVYLTGLSQPARNSGERRNEKNQRRNLSDAPWSGIHESWEFYDRCETHFPNGGSEDHVPRSGFECWAERNSFVYEKSSPWTDIAYLLDGSTENCETLQNMAWEPKYECVEMWNGNQRKHRSAAHNQENCEDEHDGQWLAFYNYMTRTDIETKEDCEKFDDDSDFKYQWGRPMNWKELMDDVLSEEACLILHPKPECQDVHDTRSNIISSDDTTFGDGDPNWIHDDSPGKLPSFKWRLPAFLNEESAGKIGHNFETQPNQRCVMRIRQFISTNEELIHYGNREIQINSDPLYLAVPQWRTLFDKNAVVFEDRSHVFKLKHREQFSGWEEDQTIHNVIVKGKRGNIVQTFPALEYDFSPNYLSIANNDALHIQWTGSNSHDNDHGGDGQAGDDGEGRGGTDRHNFMQILNYKDNFPMPYEANTFFKSIKQVLWTSGETGNSGDLDQDKFNIELAYASGGYYWCHGRSECDKAENERERIQERYDDVSPTFEGVVFIPGDDQEIYYMCLRNNNFSNRSQKGRLTVGFGPAPEGEPVPVVDHDLSNICGKPIYTSYFDPTTGSTTAP